MPKTLLQTVTFSKWQQALKKRDGPTAARIAAEAQKLTLGLGFSKDLKDGVMELKMDFGPGYRAYYTIRSDVVILLLCGGDKATQEADVKRAKRMVAEMNRTEE